MSGATACPVCTAALVNPTGIAGGDYTTYECPTCGPFTLTGDARVTMSDVHEQNAKAGALLSYAIRQMQKPDKTPFIDIPLRTRLVATTKLPTPAEQARNLILWLGDQDRPGEHLDVYAHVHRSIIGAATREAFTFVISELIGRGLIEGAPCEPAGARARLTMRGWEEYEQLKRGRGESRTAFMALQFGDAALDRMVAECFKPAVEETGFRLLILNDDPKAGVIDDHLRVAIRTARFLLADLTHENRGAYWEAGFAEGLGKPVILLCEEGAFKRGVSHFDTNHQQTVLWRADDPALSATRLKDTIRATLPAEAKMTDDEQPK